MAGNQATESIRDTNGRKVPAARERRPKMKYKEYNMRKLTVILLICCVAVPSVFAAGASEQAAKAQQPVEILISAAASLTDCMKELGDLYMSGNPAVKITGNYGSSGALQQQIEQGAPADIFFSAGVKQMKALQDKGLMDDSTVRNILENKVVLIVPKGNAAIASFDALSAPSIKLIGVGEPKSVPVGQYTEQIFASLGMTDTLAPKLVLAKDVREVLSWVETGNVDAGIVYETDAKISDKIDICCSGPEGSHNKVIYPVGVVKDSKNPAQAKAFVDFFFTEPARQVFAKYGFSVL